MTGVLIRREYLDTETQGEHHVTMKAEIGMMHLQAKECQQPPEAGRGRKELPLEPSERAPPC